MHKYIKKPILSPPLWTQGKAIQVIPQQSSNRCGSSSAFDSSHYDKFNWIWVPSTTIHTFSSSWQSKNGFKIGPTLLPPPPSTRPSPAPQLFPWMVNSVFDNVWNKHVHQIYQPHPTLHTWYTTALEGQMEEWNPPSIKYDHFWKPGKLRKQNNYRVVKLVMIIWLHTGIKMLRQTIAIHSQMENSSTGE